MVFLFVMCILVCIALCIAIAYGGLILSEKLGLGFMGYLFFAFTGWAAFAQIIYWIVQYVGVK